MRPETGNNRPTSDRKVSIQQPLDGHSFSIPEAPAASAGDGRVEIELLFARTMLVPEALHDEQRAAAWFAMNGMPLAPDEIVVATEARSGCVALIALPRTLVAQLREKWGDGIRFTTPLLHVPADTAKCVWALRTGGLTYVKIFDGPEMRFAEVLPSADDTDLLYLFERLGGSFALRDYVLRLSGADAKAMRRLIGKRFKRVICES